MPIPSLTDALLLPPRGSVVNCASAIPAKASWKDINSKQNFSKFIIICFVSYSLSLQPLQTRYPDLPGRFHGSIRPGNFARRYPFCFWWLLCRFFGWFCCFCSCFFGL